MDFSFDENIMLLRNSIKHFADNVVEPRWKEIEENDAIPPELNQMAKEMGLFGLNIPTKYGGIGLGMVEKCAVYEMLGRCHAGFTAMITVQTSIASSGIVRMGNEQQKRRYLTPMASGEKIGAFALTEPDAGSDASNLKTSAVKRGNKWIINGTKHFITNGPVADIITVMAVTDKSKGAKGITAFIVEKEFPGFYVGKTEKKMGLRGSYTSELIFQDCEVPAENVLGQENEGYTTALKIMTDGRAGLGARIVGNAQKVLELSINYAQERLQFGKPIGANQAIQFYIAEMATEIRAARALVFETAWMVDQGTRVLLEAAMVKLFASEMLGRVVDKAVQIFGGMGYMRETPVEHWYRDARIARIYEGTSEIQKMIISSQLIGREMIKN